MRKALICLAILVIIGLVAGFAPRKQAQAPTIAQVPDATTTDVSNGQKDLKIVTAADDMKSVDLSLHEQFIINLGGGLSWSLSFDPKASISRVPDSSTAKDVYEADRVGTTTLTAVGAPVCSPGGMCPQFRREVKINLNVK